MISAKVDLLISLPFHNASAKRTKSSAVDMAPLKLPAHVTGVPRSGGLGARRPRQRDVTKGLLAIVASLPERLIRADADVLALDVVTVSLDVGTFEDCSLHPAQTHSDPGCTWLREIFQHTARAL